MRHSLKESIFFGVLIALIVLLVRALMMGAPTSQIAALIIASVILAGVQLALGARGTASTPSPKPPAPTSAARRRPRDPFAHEANQSWTGLQSVAANEPARHNTTSTNDLTPSEQPGNSPPSAATPPSPAANDEPQP